MLTPRQIEAIGNDITQIYTGVESACIKSIVKAIQSGNQINDSTLWQMKKLNDIGFLKKDLITEISKQTKSSEPQIKQLIENSLRASSRYDLKMLDSLRTNKTDIATNKAFQRVLSKVTTGVKNAINLTNTKAIQGSVRAYTQAINTAYLSMATGNTTMEQAVKQAVEQVAKSSITIVDKKEKVKDSELIKKDGTLYTTYKNGDKIRMYPLDSAIRRDVITQLNQAGADLTIKDCNELGCNLVITSSHLGARPEHEVWQGQVFSLDPNDKRYGYFYGSLAEGLPAYGDMLGICGINCYHSFSPYLEGSPKVEEETRPTKEENDKAYLEQQQQRSFERSLRKLKLQQIAQQQGGYNDEARHTQQRINTVSKQYHSFLQQTGRTRISMLDSISGYKKISTKVTQTPTTLSDIIDRNFPFKQGKAMTFEDADGNRANPHFYESSIYQNNCQTCVVANEARRRGYDVEARGITMQEQKDLANDSTLSFINANLEKIKVNSAKELYDILSDKISDKERYFFSFAWKQRVSQNMSGHIVCLEKINGKLQLFCPQSNKIYTGKALFAYLQRIKLSYTRYGLTRNLPVDLMRVDNLKFSDLAGKILKAR